MTLNFLAINDLLMAINYTPEQLLKWLDDAYHNKKFFPCLTLECDFVILDGGVRFYVDAKLGPQIKLPIPPLIERKGVGLGTLWIRIMREEFDYKALRAQYVTHYGITE